MGKCFMLDRAVWTLFRIRGGELQLQSGMISTVRNRGEQRVDD